MGKNASAKKTAKSLRDLQDFKVTINYVPISEEEREEKLQGIADILVRAAIRTLSKSRKDEFRYFK